MLKNQLKNYISSNLDVNIVSAISLDREKYYLSYDISLFMNRRLVLEISLFSQICCKPPYTIKCMTFDALLIWPYASAVIYIKLNTFLHAIN